MEENSLEGSGKDDEIAEIHNLTAEIESFVRTADTDKAKLRYSPEKVKSPAPKPPSPVKPNIENITRLETAVISSEEQTKLTSKDVEQVVPIEVHVNVNTNNNDDRLSTTPTLRNIRDSPENNEEYPERTPQTPDRDIPKELHKTTSEKQLNITETINNNNNNSPVKEVDKIKYSPPKIIIRNATEDVDDPQIVTTPISTEMEFILEEHAVPLSTPNQVEELKITESTDDLTDLASKSNTNKDSERYRIRFVALKGPEETTRRDSIENGKESNNEIQNSHDDDEDVVLRQDPPLAPPTRRRSVKEIIASINKSQSLLKINQEPQNDTENHRLVNSLDRIGEFGANSNKPMVPPKPTTNISELNESIVRSNVTSEQQIKRLISEMEATTPLPPLTLSGSATDSSHIPVMVEKFDEYMNSNGNENGDYFKKCVVMREKKAVEWNPVPKPRRSRNLTIEGIDKSKF